jgi:MFS family permease
MATVGTIVPFIGVLSRELAASPAQLGLAIALFSLPTAILATVGGGLIDKYGPRLSLLFATAIAALGSLGASQAQSLLAFDAAVLVTGLGFGGICISAPCLIIATLSESARIRAMSFFSTFAPTGYAAGLLLAVPFTDAGSWRAALIAHAALMATAFVMLLLFTPRVSSAGGSGAREPLRQTMGRMLRIVREPRAIRLGIAVALPNAVSYGTSLAAPAYLARAHDLSLATSSANVAFAKIAALVIGGLSMGYLLSRAVRASLLFTIMATGALILWLFAFGGMAGGAMTLLPTVVRDPSQSGAAAGLLNQFISVASFATPSTWLALNTGVQYVLLATTCLLISLIALPTATTAQPQPRPQST